MKMDVSDFRDVSDECRLQMPIQHRFGWNSIFTNRPKLAAWWDAMQADDVGARVCVEGYSFGLYWGNYCLCGRVLQTHERMMKHMKHALPQITAELQDGLRAWDDGGRWEQRGIAQQIKDTSHRWSW